MSTLNRQFLTKTIRLKCVCKKVINTLFYGIDIAFVVI
jgi:hypothetical protein